MSSPASKKSPADSSSPETPWNIPRFVRAKSQGKKLSMLTAYDYLWAKLLDEAGVDSLLVGDSMGMVVQGHANTLRVTLDQIIYHGEMVVRAAKRALVIVDLPFLTYHVSPEQAVESAGRILKETGATAVKLEGGVTQSTTIRRLADAGIPVMAHVGMRPQSVLTLGGMGKVQRDREQILADAVAAEQAGAFSIVLELIPRDIAGEITRTLKIPTIGIGAGPDCDGQVLVTPDMLGLIPDFNPRFVKKYAQLADSVKHAVAQYADEVAQGLFPSEKHSHD